MFLGCLAAALLLTACSSAPTASQIAAVNSILSGVDTRPAPATIGGSPGALDSAAPPSTSTMAVRMTTVPDVVGQPATPTRVALRSAGLRIHNVDSVCSRGKPASQGVVVASLVLIGGRGESTPLTPGASVPSDSLVGVTWSSCAAPAMSAQSGGVADAAVAAGRATQYGCAAALSYLAAYAAPGFTASCPGNADGHQAATVCSTSPCDGGTIAIADPCPAAYMNEASNSWVLIGDAIAPIDPYGSCG